MKRLLMSGVATLALCLALGGAAKADTVILDLTNGFITTTGTSACPVLGCAQVSINVAAGGGSATLEFTSLMSGFQFDTVGFNFNGNGTGTITTPGTTNPGNEDGFGVFMYNFDTGINGGSTGSACSGSSADPDCNFFVNITGSGLTAADFETLSTSPGKGSGGDLVWFAGHIASASCTGYVGGGGGSTTASTGGSCGTTSAPEPGTLTMLGFGLLSIGGFARRRFLTS